MNKTFGIALPGFYLVARLAGMFGLRGRGVAVKPKIRKSGENQ